MSMVRQLTRLPGASTSLPAYWQSKAISTDWQCAMRVLHGKEKFDSSRAARRKKMQAAAGVRRHKRKSVKLDWRAVGTTKNGDNRRSSTYGRKQGQIC